MKIPKSITILGRKIKISKVSPEILRQLSGIEASGLFDGDDLVIYLNRELSEREMLITLNHEFGHSLLNTVGISQVISPELAEIICDSFANGIFDLVISLKPNKQLKTCKKKKKSSNVKSV